MKILLAFISLSAWAWGAVLTSSTPDAYTLTSTVSSDSCPSEHCSQSATGGGTFVISFSGFEHIYPPDFPYEQLFRITIPVTQSASGKLGYAGGENTVNGHFYTMTNTSSNGSASFNLTYDIPIASMDHFLLPIDIEESAEAESFDMRRIGGLYYPTSATSSVTVNFAGLKLERFPGVDITSQVLWEVTQDTTIPEPSTALLTSLAVALGLGVAMRRRLAHER